MCVQLLRIRIQIFDIFFSNRLFNSDSDEATREFGELMLPVIPSISMDNTEKQKESAADELEENSETSVVDLGYRTDKIAKIGQILAEEERSWRQMRSEIVDDICYTASP